MECWFGDKFFGVALVFVVEVFFVDLFSMLLNLAWGHGFVCENLLYEASFVVFLPVLQKACWCVENSATMLADCVVVA